MVFYVVGGLYGVHICETHSALQNWSALQVFQITYTWTTLGMFKCTMCTLAILGIIEKDICSTLLGYAFTRCTF